MTVRDEDIVRLDEERQQADRAYNSALTAVDAAAARPPFEPAPPPGPDDARLAELNTAWEIIPTAVSGWRGHLANVLWRAIAPLFLRQQAFNAALVDHLNRNHARQSEARDAMAALAAGITAEVAALARFESRLIGYLQQVTAYVDTKDRYEAGRLRQLIEHRTAGLAAGLDAVGDEVLKRWERATAREQRLDARVEGLRALLEARQREGQGAIRLKPDPTGATRLKPDPTGEPDPTGGGLDPTGETYVGFEDRFRGAEELIGDRLAEYLPLFAGARDVVDLGCGRGEFLDALRAQGIRGRGVDLNPEMVRRCRERGLDVSHGDALEYLATLPDGSIDGVFAAQVIEHLQPDRLLQLIALARDKVRPGGRVVLETINPACWYAYFSSYILDLTHVRPIHPETLRYLLTAAGFDPVEIRYSSPYPREQKLRPVPLSVLGHAPDLADLVEAFNGNVEKLNALIFTHLDYAGIGGKKGDEGG